MFRIFVFHTRKLLEALREQTPFLTSAQMTPMVISCLVAAGTTGRLLNNFRTSTVMRISMTFFFIRAVMFATMPVDRTYWEQTFVGILVPPWGVEPSFPGATIILSLSMPRRH